MTRCLLALLLLASCSSEDVELSTTSYVFQLNMPEWQPMTVQLREGRVGHSVAVLGETLEQNPNFARTPFVVIGGARATSDGGVEPTLEIESCDPYALECVVIGQLAYPVEKPEVAIVGDGRILISDHQRIQVFTPATNTIHVLELAVQHLVGGPAPKLLGVVGGSAPNLQFSEGLVALESLPIGVESEVANADCNGILVASRVGSAWLEYGINTWTVLPGVPTSSALTFSTCDTVFAEGDDVAYRIDVTSGRWRTIPLPASDIQQWAGWLLITRARESWMPAADTTWIPGPTLPPRTTGAPISRFGTRTLVVGGSAD